MERDFVRLQRETQKENRKQALRIFFGRGVIVKLCTGSRTGIYYFGRVC